MERTEAFQIVTAAVEDIVHYGGTEAPSLAGGYISYLENCSDAGLYDIATKARVTAERLRSLCSIARQASL